MESKEGHEFHGEPVLGKLMEGEKVRTLADAGGLAFPQAIRDGNKTTYHFGITVRDYFAGQVLVSDTSGSPKNRAEWAYEVADAMLKARLA